MTPEEEITKLRTALNKINDIRNSIVGYQQINWSAHIYPLVAALEEAGIRGMGYDKAKEMAMDQIARIKDLEAWKESMMQLWSPVIDYCQENGDKLGIKLGHSIPEFVLNMLKERT